MKLLRLLAVGLLVLAVQKVNAECEGAFDEVDTGLIPLVFPETVLDLGRAPLARPGQVQIRVRVGADVDGPTERISVFLNDTLLGEVGGTPPARELATSFLRPSVDEFNAILLGAPTLTVRLVPSETVDEAECPNNQVRVRLIYNGLEDCDGDGQFEDCADLNDCDGDGICDEGTIALCPPGNPGCQDRNNNGVPDGCDIANCPPDDLSCQDCDGNGRPDGTQPDCDGDGVPDACDSVGDCNGNGVPDQCDILNCDPGDLDCQDCNGNGIPDGCETVEYTSVEAFPPVDFSTVVRLESTNLALGPVEFELRVSPVRDRSGSPNRNYVDLRFSDNQSAGRFMLEEGPECTGRSASITVPAEVFNGFRNDDQVQVTLFNVGTTGVEICSLDDWELEVKYPSRANDCDKNGVLDECEGVIDCDGNGRCADCDGDRETDECVIAECPPGDTSCADCDGNLIPDGCDLRDCDPNDIRCQDCNGNDVPDRCDGLSFDVVEGSGRIPNFSGTIWYVFPALPIASRPVQITVRALGDYSDGSEWFELFIGDVSYGRFYESGGVDCELLTTTLRLSPAEFNALRDQNGDLRFLAVNSELVVSDGCRDNGGPSPRLVIVLEYTAAGPGDCNANAQLDTCEIAAGAPDLDGNLRPDDCDPDCNNNGLPDGFDLQSGGSSDCNLNGVPDECEDCDRNGLADECDINDCPPGDPSCADCNGNGLPDRCDPDCDLDGVPDACVIADCPPGDLACVDCDQDGVPDGCQINNCVDDPRCVDCNNNGLIDGCEGIGFRGVTSPDLFPPEGENDRSHLFAYVPQAGSDVLLTVRGFGRRFDVDVVLGTLELGSLFRTGLSCRDVQASLVIPKDTFNNEYILGTARFTLESTPTGVDLCEGGLQIELEYTPRTDCNNNQVLDRCDLNRGTSLDTNDDQVPDECQGDCDGNGIFDSIDIGNGAVDCDNDVIPDSCQLPGRDVLIVNSRLTDSVLLYDAATRAFERTLLVSRSTSLGYPNGLVIDGDRVFLASVTTNSIFEIRLPAGEVVQEFTDPALAGPVGLALSPSGTLLVSSYGTDSVLEFSSDGNLLGTCFVSQPGDPVQLDGPTEIIPAPTPGHYYLASQKNNLVLEFAACGGFVGLAAEGGGLDFPSGILLGADGMLLVSSLRSNAVHRYDPVSATLLNVLVRDDPNTPIDEAGGLGQPEGLGITSSETLIVSSRATQEILEFDAQTGAFLGVYASGGALGEPTFFRTAIVTGDCDQSGTLDRCELDSDGDGLIDACTPIDCNQNGIADFEEIAQGIAEDCNTNGVPDVCELLPDLDNNGGVGVEDLAILLANYGESGATRQQGDIDGDGVVGLNDLAQILAAFGC